jgi:hypothetical protein
MKEGTIDLLASIIVGVICVVVLFGVIIPGLLLGFIYVRWLARIMGLW